MKRVWWLLLLAGLAGRAFAWGDEGHETVGAMADQLLAGSPAEAHVKALLGDETLATASVWADMIKYRTNHWPEAIAFREANTNHAALHYTDIPFEEAKYRDDSIGARPDDVVHAITACILILQGKPGEQHVLHDVSPKIALRLLAHYVGDIHQPLHVGSGYLAGTTFIDPNGYNGEYTSDLGGNQLMFSTNKLHFYWDVTTVQQAMEKAGARTPQAFAAKLLAQPPPPIPDNEPLLDWSRGWADESLGLSARAHEVQVLREEDSVNRYTGKKQKRWEIANLTPEYIAWATDTAATQITKAGYRLARTLEMIWP